METIHQREAWNKGKFVGQKRPHAVCRGAAFCLPFLGIHLTNCRRTKIPEGGRPNDGCILKPTEMPIIRCRLWPTRLRRIVVNACGSVRWR